VHGVTLPFWWRFRTFCKIYAKNACIAPRLAHIGRKRRMSWRGYLWRKRMQVAKYLGHGAGVKPSHRKDTLHAAYRVMTRDGATVVDCRIYWPGSVAYACLWVGGDDIYTSGSGKAGGFGYCKESAAIGDAIESAGFDLSEDIYGRGTTQAEKALLAVAAFVTEEPCFIVRVHP
jgi:hypothetical protein